MTEIRIGHSPDPDDAFMFWGFASGQVEIPGHRIQHVLHDIQTLNELATGPDPLEVTAISLHAYLGLEDRYEWLEVGTSVGRGYGPRLVAREPMPLTELAGRRIALPGPKTTATLISRGILPPFEEVHLDFTRIIGAVADGSVDAGVLIHEGQLTYADHGLALLADLGELFAERHAGLPLPLGVNCARRDLGEPLRREIAAAYRRSVEIALEQRDEAVDYALQFGRGLDRDLADTFVGMYVNEDSLDLKDDLKRAVSVVRESYGRHATAGPPTRIREKEPMSDREEIVKKVLESGCFANEVAYAEAAAFRVRRELRLYKELEDEKVRVVFPVDAELLEEGAVVAITCLFDRREDRTVYAHTICAGPGANPTLKAVHSPLGRATPQPGVVGDKEVLRFVEWKKAAWGRFLNDELDLGNRAAAAVWTRGFWRALDRMFGGGVLHHCPDDYHFPHPA
jgi:1,4-dihydroxy-6-naphthoate synthase